MLTLSISYYTPDWSNISLSGSISVVTIMLMLMHEGCFTIKCGSTMCQNYKSTCDVMVVRFSYNRNTAFISSGYGYKLRSALHS